MDAVRHQNIGVNYPDTEEDFLKQRFSQEDSPHRNLFFVLLEGSLVCFFSTSRKLGRGIKLGPVWVHPSFRGSRSFDSIARFVSGRHPYEKLYLTCPEANIAMSLASRRAGFQLSAKVHGLYTSNTNELIYSKPALHQKSWPRKSVRTNDHLITKHIAERNISLDACSVQEIQALFSDARLKRGGALCLNPSNPEAVVSLSYKRRNGRKFIYAVVSTEAVQSAGGVDKNWDVTDLGDGNSILISQ